MEHGGMDTIKYEIVCIFQLKICFLSEILASLLKMGYIYIIDAVLRVQKGATQIDPFQQSPEYKSVSHTLQSSSHSVHMIVASGNFVVNFTGNSYFWLADNTAG
jgi:hypothetical protein